MASSQRSQTNTNTPNFFTRNERRKPFHPNITKKAQTAFNLVSCTPRTALNRIQELCLKHSENALLYRTQAEILEKCSDVVTDLGRKKKLMEEAIECSRKSITLSPNSMNFFSFLGYLLYKTGDYKHAIQEFNNALNLSKPSDPAQETLLTDEEIQSMSPTYEARIEDARKCILKHIGDCVLMLKKLKAYSVIQECLQTVEVNNNEERLHVAWYSLNLSEKRLLLEEHLEGTVRNVAIKKYDAATTGTEEVGYSLKIKETTDKLPLPVDNQENYKGPTFVGLEHDVDGTTQDNLDVQDVEMLRGEAQIEPEVPEVEILGEVEQVEVEEIDIENFVEFVQSGENLVILTGERDLRPNCYNSSILQMWQNMSRVLQCGPMALIIMSEDQLDQAVAPFPEMCKAVVLQSSMDFIGSDVVATTLLRLRNYLSNDFEEHELDDIRLVVINSIDGVLIGFPEELREELRECISKYLKAAQVVLVNSLYNAEVEDFTHIFGGSFKILDFSNMDI